MKLLLKYLRACKWIVILSLSLKMLGALAELVIPYILSHILDHVVPEKSVKSIIIWGAVMIGFALLACVSNIVSNRLVVRVARDVTKSVRHRLFERTMHLSSRQIDHYTIPSIESRMTSDTYNINHFINITLRMGIRAPILLIGGILITSVLDPFLTLVMVVVLPLIGVTVFTITKKGIPLFKNNQRSVDGMIRIVREDAQGIRVIKALSKVDYERRRYDKANKKLVESETHASTTMAASNPIVTLLLNIGLVSVIVVGAFRVNGDLSETGKIIAFIQYFTMISNAMIGITRIFVGYTKGAASAERIAEIINTEPDLEVVEADGDDTVSEDVDMITFDNVSFSYLGNKNNVSDISFFVRRGQSLGIIGATGSGKTTLLQLLMRFYDVNGGRVLVGGRDVRTIPHEKLNTMFGVVMQNDFIYAGTIKDNIDFGRGIDDAEISRAAGIAQAADFIEAYEDGYEHMLNSKGSNLSGGQRQRVLISRAVAGSPEILVLDDSSSALDYKTDAALRRALREQMTDTTVIVVAQRVSSVMNCDLIIVLDEGRIVGKGTHDELLATCDIYKEISDSQIGGAIID